LFKNVKTLPPDVLVFQFRSKIVLQCWCWWAEAALFEPGRTWAWNDHVALVCRPQSSPSCNGVDWCHNTIEI